MACYRLNKRQIGLLLLCAGIICVAATSACLAATLKDIRIGEYDDYTRLVFEFDQSVGTPRIERPKTGLLNIAFSSTDLGLTRKIPIDRTKSIEEIEIRVQSDQVMVTVSFPFKHFRFKWFALPDPARTVFDIFEFPEPLVSTDEQTSTFEEQPRVAKISEPLEQSESPPVPVERDPVQPTEPAPAPSPSDLPDPASATVDSGGSQLRFILVVVLLIITITLLVMLLLVLLFRRGKASVQPQKQYVDALLHEQKQRISEINERIQEQLKHYDQTQ